MTEHYSDDRVIVYQGDCREVMATLDDSCIDAIVCDPPYELKFMSKGWDGTGVAFDPATWKECMRVLKPGGHLLAFGGSRTWHRMAVAIEDAGFEMRDSIAWLYGSGFPKSMDVSKAIDKAAGATREVVGTRKKLDSYGEQAGNNVYGGGPNHDGVQAITAPATDAAKQWQGWGTALKPGYEPVVVARKPAGYVDILATIGSHLDELENLWRAQDQGRTTPIGEAVASRDPMDTSLSASTVSTFSSIVTSWRECLAAICDLMNTSTTTTTSATTTDLRTLSSCLSKIMDESTHLSATRRPGSMLTVTAADNLFASVVCGLRATRALSVTGTATDDTHTPPQGGGGLEPIVVARKPLGGRTVAANVLEHGTGALNIDATRIKSTDERKPVTGFKNKSLLKRNAQANDRPWMLAADPEASGAVQPHDGGRWPANVLLDGAMADQLDEQSGITKSSAAAASKPMQRQDNEVYDKGLGSIGPENTYSDSGGASRFFPTFRYQAKAPAKERPKVDGVSHPTVKPLELMRWLIRLVTPPDGVLLDPFAGSGTTLEAAMIEGVLAIGIEFDPTHLPLIMHRIGRQTPTTEETTT